MFKCDKWLYNIEIQYEFVFLFKPDNWNLDYFHLIKIKSFHNVQLSVFLIWWAVAWKKKKQYIFLFCFLMVKAIIWAVYNSKFDIYFILRIFCPWYLLANWPSGVCCPPQQSSCLLFSVLGLLTIRLCSCLIKRDVFNDLYKTLD
jgi:hypothetical protein